MESINTIWMILNLDSDELNKTVSIYSDFLKTIQR